MDKPIDPTVRLFCCSYLAAALTSVVAMEAAFWYVAWHDSWQNPRGTISYMLWANFRETLQPVLLLLVMSGVPLAFCCPRSWYRWGVLGGFVASLVALNHCFGQY